MSLITFPNSGNTYYFLSFIPTDLIEYFEGVREFRISLKCAIKSRSVKTFKILDKKVAQIFDEIREGMKSLDIEDIKEILRIEVRKQILHTHHIFEGTNRWSQDGVKKSPESVRLKESNLKDSLDSDLKEYQSNLDSKLEVILESLDIQFEKDSINFKKLRNKFIDLYLLRYDWMRELLNESNMTDSDFRLNAQQKLKIVLFPELSNPTGIDKKNTTARNTHLQPIIENIHSPEPIEPYLVQQIGLLSSNIKTFLDRKRIEGKIIKEVDSDRVILEEFIEIVGDIDFSRITKKEVSSYIDVQTKLPPNRKKSKKYRDNNIKQLVEMNLPEEEIQTPQNINKKLTKLSVFVNWGVRQGLIDTNPFLGMKFSVKKSVHSRKPLTSLVGG